MIVIKNIKHIFKKSITTLGIALCSFTVYGTTANHPLAGPVYHSTATPRTHVDDIRENLPPLAQPAAIEFCDAMQHAFTSLWPNNSDQYVQAWSEFFRSVIFQKEMNIKNGSLGKPVDMSTFLNSILRTSRSSPEYERVGTLLVLLESRYLKTSAPTLVNNINPFSKKLNALHAYKKIKKSNPYGLFLDGFLELIQGIQGKDDVKRKEGEYKLVLSAYGLNERALVVLQNLDNKRLVSTISNITSLRDNVRRLNFKNFMQYAVDYQLYLNYSSSPYFMERNSVQQAHFKSLMSIYFRLFCNCFRNQLAEQEQQFYEKLDKKLREKFISHREEVSRIKTVGYITDNYIAPIISSTVLSYLLFSDLSENGTAKGFQILGGVFSTCYTIFKMIQGIYECYMTIHTPSYNENQIRLTALYLSFRYGDSASTADSLGQQLIDYLDDHYDSQKTISQNAAHAFKEETLI